MDLVFIGDLIIYLEDGFVHVTTCGYLRNAHVIVKK